MKRPRQIAGIALGILLACYPLFALNPSLEVNQYAHTAWKAGEGLPSGAIRAITQTADGYLWLGTEFGLLRFDGVRAVPWQPPTGEHLPSSDIRSLRGARDGRLWIGTFTGLTSLKDGRLTQYPELDGQVIEALLEDHEGTIWVASWAPTAGQLCSIQSGKMECYGGDGRFGSGVTPLYEDSRGNLWAGAINGLWRWKPGPPKLYPMPDPAERIYALTESDDGGILVASRTGITKLLNEKTQNYPIPAAAQFQPYRLLRDRNGGLWIGDLVDRGLLHIHEGKMDVFSQADGLSGDSIASLFEDREGNVWVASLNGLDRFRDFAVPAFSVQQGLSSHGVFSLLSARDGSIWMGMSNGVNRWNKGQITIYRDQSRRVRRSFQTVGSATAIRTYSKLTVQEITDSRLPAQAVEYLFQDNHEQIWIGTRKGVAIFKSQRFFPVVSVPTGLVHSITADQAGNIWISHERGLLRLVQEQLVELIPWTQLGRKEPATAVMPDARRGGLWLGFRDGGVGYFKDGQLRASYEKADGLGEGQVRSFYADGSGSLWAASESGLSRIQDGRIPTLSSRNGLPCSTVHWMMEDDANSVWLYMACGLVRIPRSELEAWASHPDKTIRFTLFDSTDGVSSHHFTGGYSTSVARTADGKLWFLRGGGVSVLDPHYLPVNELPPPVHVEQITADEKTYDAKNGLRLPARVRNLAIDYTALSLVAPERVRFRYKLEGQNRRWHEVVNDREVQYTNLAPGNYRFRVIACNNSGVWNETGDTLEFVIPPAWYQTRWFYALCAATFLLMLWGLYRLRVLQLQREFNATLEGRVAERTRVARDIHDTLLQSFHGLMLRFGIVDRLLPGRAEEAKKELQRAMELATAALTEGRDAVQGLRDSTLESNDLVRAIQTIGEELAGKETNQNGARFAVRVEGASRELRPLLRDEVYRIATEALRNAFRHANASRVEAEIRYGDKQLRLRVVDDGKGIASTVLSGDGPEGHYGLRGMRERAQLVGGKLAVWSQSEGGTEIELTIPARNAYETGQRTSWWVQRFSGKESGVEHTKIES